MRSSILPATALTVVLMAAASSASADLVTLTYNDLRYTGTGHATNDPPPPGFSEAFAGTGTAWARIVYDDDALSPIGPVTDMPLGYEFNALRSLTIGVGNRVFEASFAEDALGTFHSYRYPNSVGSTLYVNGPPTSGPDVLGLQPTWVYFSWGYFPGAASSFPDPDAMRYSALSGGVTFQTPSGGVINTQLVVPWQVNPPVPEPEGLLMMFAGGLLVARAARRRA